MRAAWLALALAALPVAVNFVSPGDLDRHDQARQALYVLDASQGHWLVPRARGEIATKPPLYTWIAALGALPFGLGEHSVRLPSVLATLGLGLVMLAMARRLHGGHGDAVGLLAVALVATTQHVGKLATLVRTDMLFAFWIALALLGFLQRRALLFWIAAALATLTKGPAGFAIPLLAVALAAAWRRDPEPLRSLRPLCGSALLLLLVGAWLVPALWLHGDELWRVVFQGELLDRLQGTGSRATKAHHPFWYLLPLLFAKLVPWSPLAAVAATRVARGAEPQRAERLLLVTWVVAGLVVMSLPAAKRADYLLPIHAPAALLAAAPLWQWTQGATRGALDRAREIGVRTWAALCSAAAALLLPLALAGALPHAPAPSPWVFAAGGGGALLLAPALRRRTPRLLRLATALAAQLLLALLWAQLFATPVKEPDAPVVRAFAREVSLRSGGAPLEFHGARVGALAFLLRRNVPDLEVAELERRAALPLGTWVVLSESAYARLAADPERFARLGAPAPELRSAPLARRRGDRLLLLRLGGTHAPSPRRRRSHVAPGRGGPRAG